MNARRKIGTTTVVQEEQSMSTPRKIGALAVVAAIGLVAAACTPRTGEGQDAKTPADQSPTALEAPSSEISPLPTPDDLAPDESPPVRRHVKSADGVPFSFRAPARGWERFGSISLNKSETGSQGAEAMIYWSSFPGGDYVDYYNHEGRPCTRLLSPPVGPSATDLADAISKAPGTELVKGPSDVTVDGYPAKHVVLTVREAYTGCDPGFFYTWRDVNGGALWRTTPAGATLTAWIVDVDGTRLFIGAATTRGASSNLDHEIQQIVGSIHFDR